MAELLESSVFPRLETLIWAAKLVFVFVGFISTVFLFKVAVIPYTFNFLSTLSTLWISLQSWLSPPFLYIIVNFIIFFIVICSFPPNQSKPQPSDEKIAISGETTAFEYKQPDPNLSEDLNMEKKGENKEEEKQMVWNFSAMSNETVADPQSKEYFFPDYGEIEGCVEEAVADDDDSLEATWQSIMEAKGNDERHLKKSETFGTPPSNLGRANAYGGHGGGDEDPVAWAKRELRKSDTFNDRVSYKREKSMSQEELKRRSEEFINKINSDMRLQRLESAKRFLLRHR